MQVYAGFRIQGCWEHLYYSSVFAAVAGVYTYVDLHIHPHMKVSMVEW